MTLLRSEVTGTTAVATRNNHYREHQKGKATSTDPIASIFAWTQGLKYRGTFDGTPDVVKFAETLEKVCVDAVEDGKMTKDLALLIGPSEPWQTTQQFLDTLDGMLKERMAKG